MATEKAKLPSDPSIQPGDVVLFKTQGDVRALVSHAERLKILALESPPRPPRPYWIVSYALFEHLDGTPISLASSPFWARKKAEEFAEYVELHSGTVLGEIGKYWDD
jgi:hypothetical protein